MHTFRDSRGRGQNLRGHVTHGVCTEGLISRIVAAAEFRFAAQIRYVMLHYILTAFKCLQTAVVSRMPKLNKNCQEDVGPNGHHDMNPSLQDEDGAATY